MPVVEKTRNLPESENFPFLALDADGYEVPSDWYVCYTFYLQAGH